MDNTDGREVEALGRVELPTNGLGNRCSIHLSYRAPDSSLSHEGRSVPLRRVSYASESAAITRLYSTNICARQRRTIPKANTKNNAAVFCTERMLSR